MAQFWRSPNESGGAASEDAFGGLANNADEVVRGTTAVGDSCLFMSLSVNKELFTGDIRCRLDARGMAPERQNAAKANGIRGFDNDCPSIVAAPRTTKTAKLLRIINRRKVLFLLERYSLDGLVKFEREYQILWPFPFLGPSRISMRTKKKCFLARFGRRAISWSTLVRVRSNHPL